MPHLFGNGIGFVWYGGAEEQAVVEGALVDAMEAGFVAVHEAEAGMSGGVGEDGGHAVDFVAGGLSFGVVFIDAEFEGPGAAHAPVGRCHFLDETELEVIGGLEAFEVLGEEGFEGGLRFVFHDDAAGQEAVAGGVLGRAAFSFGGSRSTRAGAVGTGRESQSD
jgi:hypothetical protein